LKSTIPPWKVYWSPLTVRGEDWARGKAVSTFDLYLDDFEQLDESMSMRTLAYRMLILALSPAFSRIDDRPVLRDAVDRSIDEFFAWFCKAEKKLILDTTGQDGEIIDGVGRLLNIGHSIKTSWFIMEEAMARGDRDLALRTAPLIEWNLNRGWDGSLGGLLLLTDIDGGPHPRPEWDMKF